MLRSGFVCYVDEPAGYVIAAEYEKSEEVYAHISPNDGDFKEIQNTLSLRLSFQLSGTRRYLCRFLFQMTRALSCSIVMGAMDAEDGRYKDGCIREALQPLPEG